MYRKKEKHAFNCFEDGTVNIENSTSIHTYLYGFLTKIKLLITDMHFYTRNMIRASMEYRGKTLKDL